MIRARVSDELGLTCSVGIAPTKFVAKVASARCKPDGLLVVPADGVLSFLHPLPITALWGVGPSTARRLERLGLRHVRDIAETPVPVLARAVGTATAAHLSALAVGHDPRPVQPNDVEKSISSDRTFDLDLTADADVRRELLRLTEDVTARLRQRGLVARTVGIKVRFADFRTLSRTRTLPVATDATSMVHDAAVELYKSLGLDRPRLRLLGVKAEALTPAAEATRQLSFEDVLARTALPRTVDQRTLDQRTLDQRTVEAAVDRARQRFGVAALRPATLISPRDHPDPTESPA